jgi:hypothetical protein
MSEFPAVDRVREDLRADLMRAARAHPRTRSRRRRRLLVLSIAALVATPASLAAAGVFDPAEVTYECPDSQPRNAVAGAPVEGPGQPAQVAPEPEGPAPSNGC